MTEEDATSLEAQHDPDAKWQFLLFAPIDWILRT